MTSVITKNGFNQMLDMTFNSASTYTPPSRFKIGTGSTAPVTANTDLETPITAWNTGSDYKNYNTTFSHDTANQKITVQYFISSTQANANTITECGSFNSDGTPIMFNRSTFTGIAKTAAIQIFITEIFKRA